MLIPALVAICYQNYELLPFGPHTRIEARNAVTAWLAVICFAASGSRVQQQNKLKTKALALLRLACTTDRERQLGQHCLKCC